MKDIIVNWANDWGRSVDIYGIKTKEIDTGQQDDLDAFRHAFCHAVLVSMVNLADPDSLIPWMPQQTDNAQMASEVIGFLMELEGIGGVSAQPCPKFMDLHNNDIGKNLGLSRREMMWIIARGDNPLQVIAERIAQAVKAEKTINRLDDPRMPIECFAKARIPAGEYIWRTQGDDKVRFNHAIRAGKVFHLDKAPDGGHPGTEHNCRCWAEPVVKIKK
ncbi:MAG: hypothetical protein EBQ80_05510 [Proteobacteria bacterium]|nr:hypothetical protein [Bacteroidota bacterium]NBX86670.1 hypothetical protein [Pseudomonadota bacterium]